MRSVVKIKTYINLFIGILCCNFSLLSNAKDDELAPEVKTPLFEQIRPPTLTELIGNEDELHIWDRYIRRFRRDHHLAAVVTYEKGNWYVGSFGKITDDVFESRGVDASLQYSFHIQLISKLGYYLGTAGGYYFELESRGDNEMFGPSSMWKLPGLISGLVYNYGATGRFTLGAAGYLARVTELSTYNSSDQNETISVTGEAFDFHFGWDRFFTLNSAFRIQYSNHQMWIPVPKNAAGYALDARLKRRSQGVSIGLIYHFL